MTRTLAALALAALGLWSWLRFGPHPAQRDRAHAPELASLVQLARAEGASVAGLSLRQPRTGESLTYARAKGRWRCLSVWNAPCDDARTESFVQALINARAVLRPPPSPGSGDFGFDRPGALEITLHGKRMLKDAAGDAVLRAVFGGRIGFASAAQEGFESSGRFARLVGDERLLELDVDPIAYLGSSMHLDLPPLVDARWVPFDFPSEGARVEQCFVDRLDGSPDASFELARRPRQARAPEPGVPPEETLPWEWLLRVAGREVVIPPLRGEAYVQFLLSVPLSKLVDPREEAAHGFDAPRARLTLAGSDGRILELEVGAVDESGALYVRNKEAPLAGVLEAALAALALPAPAQVQEGKRNEWDVWLRGRLAAQRQVPGPR